MTSLDHRVAIVTGAASGLGQACARRFSEHGAVVIVADIDDQEGRKVAGNLKGSFYKVDVTQADAVQGLVEACTKRFGRVDIMVNNAGVEGAQIPITEHPLDHWHQVMDINLNGVFYGMKYALTQMVRQGHGVILNMACTVGLTGFANIPAYSASKGGVVNLTRSAAIEYAGQGIRVNAIAPSIVMTPAVAHYIESSENPAATRQMFHRLNPMPGMVTPDAVADAALFLVSDASKFITGHTLPVDGGYLAQ